jgi:hypothetical protein
MNYIGYIYGISILFHAGEGALDQMSKIDAGIRDQALPACVAHETRGPSTFEDPQQGNGHQAE